MTMQSYLYWSYMQENGDPDPPRRPCHGLKCNRCGRFLPKGSYRIEEVKDNNDPRYVPGDAFLVTTCPKCGDVADEL